MMDPLANSQNLRGMCPIMFSKEFFYGCMQLVLGSKVTNKNTKMPVRVMESVFSDYRQLFSSEDMFLEKMPPGKSYSASLASMALTMATSMKNIVVETFEKRCLLYLEHRLRAEIPDIDTKTVKKLRIYLYNELSGVEDPPWPTSLDKTEDLMVHLNRITLTEYLGPHPITPKSLVTNICEHMSVLHQILRNYEQYNNVSSNELADQVSPWWAYQQLKDHDEFLNLTKKQRQQVSRQLRQHANGNDGDTILFTTTISDGLRNALLELVTDTRARIANSRRVKAGDDEINLDDCFVPTRSSLKPDHRLFNLLPHRSLGMPFVEVPIDSLVALVNNSLPPGSPLPKARRSTLKGIHRIREDGKTFERVFNLGAVRLARGVDNLDQYDDEEGAAGRKMPIFNNLVSTDGHTVNVSLVRPTAGPPLPDLELEDFTPELVNNHFRLWGIDPGMTHIFTATDGSSQYLKYSSAEWRAKSGFTRRLTAQRQRMTTQITDIQSRLPTTKTASVSTYATAVTSIMAHLNTLVSFYADVSWSNDRLLNYSGRRRLDEEVVKIFVDGGKKYAHNTASAPSTSSHASRFHKAAFTPSPAIPLLGMGDGSFAMTMRGTKPGMASRVKKVLKRAELEGKLVLVPVNESYTSKICSKCLTNNQENKVLEDGSRLHSVLVCKDCNTVWNRDINACNNIFFLATEEIAKRSRPSVFCHPNHPPPQPPQTMG
ncbi:hypothetical protein [Absidia glauca]|uniref:Cas12f1-like TNB domain-containing protein n=1 Tax=Absidia glauca TaxID=4829 RepID=A0A168MFD4_ABSGL|nr:hypothetical protein [Absidia glauca]